MTKTTYTSQLRARHTLEANVIWEILNAERNIDALDLDVDTLEPDILDISK
jgi:hypothetical protein